MIKTYILDTNVLIHDPNSLFSFEDNELIIPLLVLDELDRKKNGVDEAARNSRIVIRNLDELRKYGSLIHGVKTDKGSLIRVEPERKDDLSGLDLDRPDNRILNLALTIKKEYTKKKKKNKIILISKDLNLRVKCDSFGLDVEDYISKSVKNINDIFSGIKEVEVEEKIIDTLYRDGFVDLGSSYSFYPNEYALLYSNTKTKKSGLARFDSGKLVKIKSYQDVFGISSKNKEQACALDALFNPEIKLVTMIGKAGTGKTLISLASALSQILDYRLYKKLIVTRPVQPLGGRDVGFLPGDLNAKLLPWIAPIKDNLDFLFSDRGANYLDMQQESGIIEIEATTFVRGRSLNKIFMLVDEFQNVTKHEAKTIITRMGQDSKLVLLGDIHQIDNNHIDYSNNGLSYIIEKFKEHSIAAHITLQKGERGDLATIASEIL